MNKIFLALGGNVGDVKKSFEKAVELLSAKIKDIKMAPIYTSKAVGYTDQPDFFNTALVGYTDLEPLELLKFVKDVEKQTGRQERFRWGPREVDIDIIFYNNLILDSEELTIPHKLAHVRDFVLVPIADLEPGFVHPVIDKSVKEVLNSMLASNLSIYGQNNYKQD